MIEKSSESAYQNTQKLTIENRKQLSMSGVRDVTGFSEREVILSTNMGRLLIRGERLKINKLNSDAGDFSVYGYINSIMYTKDTGSMKGNFLKRIFR